MTAFALVMVAIPLVLGVAALQLVATSATTRRRRLQAESRAQRRIIDDVQRRAQRRINEEAQRALSEMVAEAHKARLRSGGSK